MLRWLPLTPLLLVGCMGGGDGDQAATFEAHFTKYSNNDADNLQVLIKTKVDEVTIPLPGSSEGATDKTVKCRVSEDKEDHISTLFLQTAEGETLHWTLDLYPCVGGGPFRVAVDTAGGIDAFSVRIDEV